MVNTPLQIRLRWRMRDPEANHDRLYEIEVLEDLFGRLHVILRWGRWGQGTQETTIVQPSFGRALEEAARRVRRRATARRRIGSGYLLVHATGTDEIRRPLVALWQRLGGASWSTEAAGDAHDQLLPRRLRGRGPGASSAPALPLFAA